MPVSSNQAVRGVDGGSREMEFLGRLASTGREAVVFAVDGQTSVLLNDPSLVKHVLVHGTRYSKDTPPNRFFAEHIADGLLTSDGDSWSHQRHSLVPAFRDTAAMREVTQDCIASACGTLDQYAESGQWFSIVDFMSELTLSMTTRYLLGLDHVAFIEPLRELGEILDASSSLLADNEQDVAPMHRRLRSAIEASLAGAQSEHPGGSRRAVIADAGGNPQEVYEQIAALLLAGYETTANALSWTWILLTQYPDVYRQWQQSLDVDEGTAHTEHLFAEALRLYPPAWLMGRRAIVDDMIGSLKIRKGSIITISPYLLHRNKSHWLEPHQFDPSRFATPGPTRRHPYAYLPFGAGARHCIGAAFARIEANAILRVLGLRYSFEAREDTVPNPAFKFVLRAPSSYAVRVHARVAAAG
jgi:cytochrome P450